MVGNAVKPADKVVRLNGELRLSVTAQRQGHLLGRDIATRQLQILDDLGRMTLPAGSTILRPEGQDQVCGAQWSQHQVTALLAAVVRGEWGGMRAVARQATKGFLLRLRPYSRPVGVAPRQRQNHA